MSGRGGRRGGGNQTARQVADALGIARYEMNNYQSKAIIEPPPLYPALRRTILPFETDTEELEYMAVLRQEIADRFQKSEFYLDKEEKKEVKRYIDKYNKTEVAKFTPNFSRLPDELCWVKEKTEENKAKRKKLDDAEMVQIKLKQLEENENGEVEKEDDEEEDKKSESDKSEQAEDEAVSEDDAEEENDYISSYFDNGEGYGDAGSDDNMDGEEY